MHLAMTLLSMLLAAPPAAGLPAAGAGLHAPSGIEALQRDKKKKRKAKKKKKIEKPEPAPEWRYADSPFGHFLWLARQAPDFADFPRATTKINLSIVAHQDKALLFLDSCEGKKKKKGSWRVSKCNAVKVKDNSFLAKLVKGGTDTSAAPDSLAKLKETFQGLSKVRKREQMTPLLLEASVKNKEGYRLLDDIEKDLEECGEKRYFQALRSVPAPAFVGPNVVVIDLTYKVDLRKDGYQVKLSLAKTKNGWRVGGLGVTCYE